MTNTNSSGRPYDILIVEDNPDDVELFMRALRRVEIDLEIVVNAHAITDGAEAAGQIKEQKFDAIFLDVNMPPPDGMELTKRIRSSNLNRTTPIVVITGAEDRGLMSRVFQAGANLFLSKPIDRMRLLRLLQVARGPIDRERRRLQRIKVKCKVGVESGRDRLSGETLDLSMGGMFIQARQVLPTGSTVNVSLSLPPAPAPIQLTARIVRVVGNEFMGLQFENIGKSESDRLGAFLVPLIVAAVDGEVKSEK